SGYVDAEDQPARTIPYTPTEVTARMYSTPTCRSVSCSGVWCPSTETSGPNGITANAMNAGITAITGASMKTGLSTPEGMNPSLSAIFTPSARLCSMPIGPTRLGPIRICIQARILRSRYMAARTVSTRNANTATALPTTNHHGSVPKAASPAWSGAARVTTTRSAAGVLMTSALLVRSGRSPRPPSRGWRPPRSRASSAAATPPGRACRSRRGGGREPRPGGAGGPGQVRFAVLHPPAVQQHPPGAQDRLAGRRVGGVAGAGRARRRRPGRGRGRARALGDQRELAARGFHVRQAEPRTGLLGERVEYSQVGHGVGAGERGVEGALAALPGEERAGLLGD